MYMVYDYESLWVLKMSLSIHDLYSLFFMEATCICWESTFVKL